MITKKKKAINKQITNEMIHAIEKSLEENEGTELENSKNNETR